MPSHHSITHCSNGIEPDRASGVAGCTTSPVFKIFKKADCRDGSIDLP